MLYRTKKFIILFFLWLGFALSFSVFPQEGEPSTSIETDEASGFSSDTISLVADSLIVDSIPLTPSRKKDALEATVNYQSRDSIIFTGEGIGYLFGEGKVTYTDIELEAEYIRMNMDSSMVYAIGKLDSLEQKVGYPVFKSGGDIYHSESILYNFNTSKGYITNVITEQGEGYITAGEAKRMNDGSFFMADGKYTTCDHHDHPHFYTHLTKAKVRPKKNVVTGPAYLVIEDVPLPLALPFGFFPFTSKYSSGVIMPSYGDESTRGFYLRDGGYYFAINDYVDLALTGEIYTKGSWGLKAASTYARRYKFRGNVNANYITTVLGDKIAGDYSVRKDFSLNWSHSQDAKASPNQTLSASVNFSTSGYNRNSLNSLYNNSYTQNTKSSTVNYSRKLFDNKVTLNTSARVDQVASDSTIQLSLPSLSISTVTLYPFKRKNTFGEEKWYEKISVSYQGTVDNKIKTKEDQLFKSSLRKDWTNGMRHVIPVQATFTIFDNINISPSFNYEERWYGSRINRSWDAAENKEVQDTVYGFNRLYNYSVELSAQTQVYGFFKPLPIFGDKVEMIRHTFRPSIGFSMTPDFTNPKYGYYDSYSYSRDGELITTVYQPFSNGIYGSPSQTKSGSINFAVDNTLEMKVKSDKDSTGIRKISLIDKLSISTSYNLVADSLNWSDILASLAIKITKSYNLNVSARFDPYTYEVIENAGGRTYQKVNVTQWKKNRIPGKLRSMTFSIPSISWNNDTFKRKKDKKDSEPTNDISEPLLDEEEGSENSRNPHNSNDAYGKTLDSDGYVKWEVPWTFNLNYNVSLVQGPFNYEKKDFDLKWNQSLSFGGSLRFSKNWNVSFSSNYNFDKKELGYTTCSISRDLHCFTMSAQVVPIGPYTSYNFTISVKSSLLKDLKWEQSSSPYYNTNWY
ncbi:MAG: LPS-assembly protein LptD [Candidatus Azobacteroides sp.]|nr:LPS-assembly protein LptD [Candidatus Azobacteroides sp.]